MAERIRDRGLKRSTVASYESMYERAYRDLGGDTPVQDFVDGRLRPYFARFEARRVVGAATAKRLRAEGKNVRQFEVSRWTAQPPGSAAVEVKTKDEAVRLADEMPGTWKHRRRGAYRVVPLNAKRPKAVTRMMAEALQAEGWIVSRRTTKTWMVVSQASSQTHNEYRDVLGAAFDYAVRKKWIDANPMSEIKRTSKKRERQRVLRRDDFYDREEVNRLLAQAPSVLEEAFWLLGADAGLRLPGEALGLRLGAIDLLAKVIRPYDNWVRNALDTTKTDDSEAIPMTPRLEAALRAVIDRGYASENDHHLFASEPGGSPISERKFRDAFKMAQEKAGLRPIKMYNLRHSFGTTLALEGVDVRTIQALMRHTRITTTEQYMAYRPRPELANQLAEALDPQHRAASKPPSQEVPLAALAELRPKLEETIPAKWLSELERVVAESESVTLAA